MNKYLSMAVCFIVLGGTMPNSAQGQTDATNVWFSNGPSGLLIVPTVVINPSFPDTLFAGSLGGSVSRSLNRGSTWTTVGGSIADSVLVLGMARSNTAIIYAGTLNRGVYKTTDHGVTWAATGLTGVQVEAVSVDPNNANRVYAGTRDSLMKSTNGGTNWIRANLDSVKVTTIAMDPLMPDTVYVGTSTNGMYRSRDDGATWVKSFGGLTSNRISEIDVHPTRSDTLYVATADGGIFRSVNGGDSFAASNNGLTKTNLTSLQISPSEPNVIYVGSSTGQVFKSTDHANNWLDISRNLSYGVPISAIAVAPDSSNVVYLGTGPLLNLGVQRLKQTGLSSITSVATGTAPEGILAGDFNADGVTDLVVANGGEDDISVYLTSSAGSVLTRNDFRTGSGPVMIAAGDLDGDRDLDLVVANQVKRTLSLLTNDSTGVFSPPK
ncbi:MAG: FG-GAP-like repeat-containing protein, partial [bacterium]|nr:FG-GAP-like repeat-containing protein [bacterium]